MNPIFRRWQLTVIILFSLLLLFILPGCRRSNQPEQDKKEDYMLPMNNVQPITRDNIIINAYLVPLHDEEVRKRQFAYMNEAEIDVVSHIYVDPVWVAEGHTADKYKQIMAEAAEYGLRIYSRDYRIQTCLEQTDEALLEIAEEYKDLPGFAGFYVVDEPVNPNVYADVENLLRSVCPDSYININFLPRGCYPEGTYYKRLTDFGSLIPYGGTLSLDTYCFDLNGGVNELELFRNYDDLRRAALATGKNTAVYVQSVGYQDHYRRPTAADLRYNMMAALAYGVKELKFFTWGTPPSGEGTYSNAIFDRDYEPTDLFFAVCEINKKIHRLGTYLASGDAVAVYHSMIRTPGAYKKIPNDFPIQAIDQTDVILSVIQPRSDENSYFMIVNKDFRKTQQIRLDVGALRLKMVDERTGALVDAPVENGVLTLQLAAGDGAVFQVIDGNLVEDSHERSRNLAVSARLFASSAAGDGTAFLCDVHDGEGTDGNGAKLITTDGRAQYITLDFGDIETLNRVDLYPMGNGVRCGAYFPKSFLILTSADGREWTEVVREENDILDRTKVPVFRFHAIQARYMRLVVTDFLLSEGNCFCEIGEIAVYHDDGSIEDHIATSYEPPAYTDGENIALHKPVLSYSSSTDQPDWNCHYTYINDGTSKVWSSGMNRNSTENAEEWIIIDLLGSYKVERVVLTPQKVWNGVNVFPDDYEIRVSQDGVQWTAVKQMKHDNTPQRQDVRTLEIEPIQARYVQFAATKLTRSGTASAGYCVEIAEMEVYGELID